MTHLTRSQLQLGVRCGYVVAHLLALWARTVAWVGCECCVFQVELFATGRTLVQWSPTECGASK